MRPRALLLAAELLSFAFSAQAEPGHSIGDLMDDLQHLQGRMAEGDRNAYPLAQEKLRAISAAISAAKPETWKDKTQTDAVASYILSGGQPREAAKLLELGAVPASEDGLLRGALAYASGRERDAQALFARIDASEQSLRLAGQLAYAQSVLLTSRDPKRAIALLDFARLVSPGSLVEEAALRREILLVSDQRDAARVVFLSRQYVTRFGHSIYAENFVQGLAAAVVKYGLSDNVEGLDSFNTLLAVVAPEQRRLFLLTVARAQIVAGQNQIAAIAAREALRDVEAESVDEMRARFYFAAAQYIDADYDAGLKALRGLDRSKLPKADQPLLEAVLFSAAHLRDQPSLTALAEAGHEDQVAAARSQLAAEAKNFDQVGQTIRRAENALASAAAVGETPP